MISDDDAILYAFQRNAFVAASAGTGKTHRLTSLYVLLTLGLTSRGQPDPHVAVEPILPSRVLATTFSRAAAGEIRARIDRTLNAIVQRALPDSLAAVLRHRLGRLGELAPSSDVLEQRARAALDDLPRAQIDTLHGFAQRLVRTHALDLGVSPRSSIEEEDETRDIIGAEVDRVVAGALGEGGPSRDAAQALLRTTGGLDALRVAAAKMFEQLDEDGLDVGALRSPDHEGEARALLAELANTASACAAKSGSRAIEASARALVAAGPLFELDAAKRSLVLDLFAQRKPGGAHATAADESLDAFRKRFGSTGSNRDRAHRFFALLDAAASLGAREKDVVAILSRIRDAVGAERRRRSVLSFGDVLRLARHGLTSHRRISATSRAAVDALFVDEFQDTSMAQRDLVFLLRETDASFARRAGQGAPRASDIEPSGLFVVGDRKQSIYGFRGADVAVFASVAAELGGAPAARALGLRSSPPVAHADFVSLRTSHRSGPAILRFVNEVARADFASLPSSLAYAESEELAAARDFDSDVVLVRGDGSAIPIDPEGFMRDAALAALMAGEARRRGFAFRDIAILARRRSTLPLVEHALERAGLPFVVAGRGLYETREVRDVAAILRLLCDPRDRHALAIVLRGPIVALSDASLVELLADRTRDLDIVGPDARPLLSRSPEEGARLQTFRSRFAAARANLLRAPPGAAVREVVRYFDLDRTIAAMPRARIRLGNVERLAEIADARPGSTAAFSRWLDRRIAEEVDEPEAVVFSEEDDAIRLTTIHGSKGLDFDAVILVDLDASATARVGSIGYRKADDGRSATLVMRHRGAGGARLRSQVLDEATRDASSRDAAERRRLSYVALTRARRLLALVEPDGLPVNGSLHATLRARLDVDGALGETVLRTVDLLAVIPTVSDVERIDVPKPRALPKSPTVRRITLATTPLATLRDCERRFQLRHVLGLTEPVQSGQLDLFDDRGPDRDARAEPQEADDPRALGRAAHRVLERWPLDRWGAATRPDDVDQRLREEGVESPDLALRLAALLSGAWARRIGEGVRRGDVQVEREVEVARDVTSADGAFTLSLRGTCDLVVTTFVDGLPVAVDVVDYKLRRPLADLSRYAFQLRAYALAVAPRAPHVRAGILFLEGGLEPVWLDGDDGPMDPSRIQLFADELTVLGRRAVDARASDTYRPMPVDHCRAIGCGFVVACHART